MNTADFLIADSRRITQDSIVEASKKLEAYMESKSLYEPPDPKGLEKQGYVYCTTSNDEIFLMEKDHALTAYVDEDEILYFPAYFADKPKELEQKFEIVKIDTNDGEIFYEVSSPLIVKPHNCRNFYRKADVHKCEYSQRYYLNLNQMVENVEEFSLVHQSYCVHTVDTGERKISERCYEYHNRETGEREYYRYRQLAPNYRFDGEPFWFDETKPVKLKGRGIGIELEYGNAGRTCLEVLKNGEFRDRWFTVRDGSIPGDGAEFVSVPFELNELGRVAEMIEFARENGATTPDSCGYHVHISGSDLNYMDLSSLINLCMGVQTEIFNYVADSRINNSYCRLLDGSFLGFSKIKSKKDRIKAGAVMYGDEVRFTKRHEHSKYHGNNARHFWLNIDRMFRFRSRKERDKRTVEFRLYQADFNTDYFMRMILLFYYMVEYAKNHSQQTCMKARLKDVVNFAPYHHRRELQLLIK